MSSSRPTMSVQPVPLLLPNVDDIVVEYAADKQYSENYTGTVKAAFFENRLPVATLLLHAVRGEMKEVNEMLTKNPLLLLEKGTVTDYSGRRHHQRTVYQLAEGAVHRNVQDEKGRIAVPGMVEMIEQHFDRLPGITTNEKNAIMAEQHAGQFPAGSKELDEKRMKDDSVALNTVINVVKEASDDDCKATDILENQIHGIIRTEDSARATELKKIINCIYKSRTDEDFEAAFNELKTKLIKEDLTNASFNFIVLKAIYKFRHHLEPNEMMTIGRHFNHQLLAEMDTRYDENYVAFGNCSSSPKNKLIWQKIFGYIERFIPACDGQVVDQGPWDILVNGEQSSELLIFRGRYFPLDSNPEWELGYNCRSGRLRAGGEGWFVALDRYAFQNLCRTKTTLGLSALHCDPAGSGDLLACALVSCGM